MTCPKGIGCGGRYCTGCLRNVDLKEYAVFYSERPEAFKIRYERITVAECAKRARRWW